MHRILALPTSLLLLIATSPFYSLAEPQWPHNLPPDARYFPEDEVHVKKGLDAMKKLVSQNPIGARKMSGDAHEMFFLDYWQFEDMNETSILPASSATSQHQLSKRALSPEYANLTMDDNLLPPLLPHFVGEKTRNWQDLFRLYSRNNLESRAFKCPTDTRNCNSINRPHSCCGTTETCVQVDNLDAGMGDVGCCPAGGNCNGQVGACHTGQGYKSCPGSSNGGCCIPNYECEGVGCVSAGGTSTTTTTLPAVTVTTCATNWHTCAASLGGGCCSNVAECASSTSCRISSPSSTSTPTTTTSITSASPTATTTAAGAPLRPTGSTNSNNAIEPSTLTTGTTLVAICPTNYYFCSAYYRPGCCQVGLDCALSNCPDAPSSTVVSSGVTIIVPAGPLTGGSTYVTTALITGVGTTSAFRSGSCAGGWPSCGADVGGGCCPPGFACGSSCVGISGQATGTVSKLAPVGGAPSLRAGRGVEILGLLWVTFAAALGFGMVAL
ncbi:hypothetical protein EJ08DRAFT_411583 [Tothia fuscella]|uniref:GPI anchored protein n=1 Tax=Tothia fuscella TaxID=1048955 RepID=A0A9P4TV24_9PEZI|nr:hypothetical protein EJ08DRAFT_411583 [Tothia fuscella]